MDEREPASHSHVLRIVAMLRVGWGLQAGLLLAETEFVMQVESDIAPFKDLLMGLFFMTVGMEISVGLFIGKFRSVMGALALLVIGKVRVVVHRTSMSDIGGGGGRGGLRDKSLGRDW